MILLWQHWFYFLFSGFFRLPLRLVCSRYCLPEILQIFLLLHTQWVKTASLFSGYTQKWPVPDTDKHTAYIRYIYQNQFQAPCWLMIWLSPHEDMKMRKDYKQILKDNR